MEECHETRLIYARLIQRSEELGILKSECQAILFGLQAVQLNSALTAPFSTEVETRLRRFLEFLDLVEEFFRERSGEWLREPNPVLALRSPVDTLVSLPGALNGLLGLLRSMRPSQESERNGYETCQQIFQIIE